MKEILQRNALYHWKLWFTLLNCKINLDIVEHDKPSEVGFSAPNNEKRLCCREKLHIVAILRVLPDAYVVGVLRVWQILSLVDTKLPDPGLPAVRSGSVVCKHRAGERRAGPARSGVPQVDRDCIVN